jgi:hypothetical protein
MRQRCGSDAASDAAQRCGAASDARLVSATRQWTNKGQQHPFVVRRDIDGHDSSRRDFFGSAG